jgi:hypothetical protein
MNNSRSYRAESRICAVRLARRFSGIFFYSL